MIDLRKRKIFKITFLLLVVLFCLFAATGKTTVAYADNGRIDRLFGENNITLTTQDNKKETVISEVFDDNSAKLNGDFLSLSKALSLSKSGDVIEYYGTSITKSVVVKKGVTLYVPSKGENDNDVGKSLAIDSGVTLTVDGTLKVGDKSDVLSPFCEELAYSAVILNGDIIVNGTAEVYLPITGGGKITVNGELIEPFYILDLKQGCFDYYENGNLPFNEYAFLNVRIERVINHGAKYVGYIYADGITEQSVAIVDSKDDRGLLKTFDGSKIQMTYDESKKVDRKIFSRDLTNVGKTTVAIYGEVEVRNFEFTLNKRKFSTNRHYFAIPYSVDVFVKNGANVRVNRDVYIKVLSGATVVIDENAALTVDGRLNVYDGFTFLPNGGICYPSCDDLYSCGFQKTGRIINNGAVNINGMFTGIVETKNTSAQITTGKSAVFESEILEGSAENDCADLTLKKACAIYGGINGFKKLERGKTYKSYAISQLTLDYYIVDKTIEGNFHAETLNKKTFIYQNFCGRFLEYKDGKFFSCEKIYIGEKIKNVRLSVCGKDYYTDDNGFITAEIYFEPDNPVIQYFTPLYESKKAFHYCSISADKEIVLRNVVKSLTLSDDNVYECFYDKEFPQLYLTVSYYGNTSQKVKITPNIKGGKYVETVNFNDEIYPSLNNVFCDLYFYVKEFDDYKNFVNGHIDQLSLKDSLTEVYDKYRLLTKNRTENEIIYLKDKLKGYDDFSYINDFTITDVIYGDTVKSAVGYTINGEEVQIQVALQDYTCENGDITATALYSGSYKGIAYLTQKKITNVKAAKLKYIIDYKESPCFSEILTLTGSLKQGELKFSDTLEDVIELKTTATKFSKADSYPIYGEQKSPFYDVTFANANYTVTKVKASVAVDDKVLEFSFRNRILFEYTEDYVGAVSYFAVFLNDQKVAKIDLYGNLSECLSDELPIGEYKVLPIADNDYYYIDKKFSSLSIINDNDDYIIDFGFLNGQIKEYDGKAFSVKVKVLNKTSGKVFAGEVETSIKLGNETVTEIKDVGLYTVSARIKEKVYCCYYQVEPCHISVSVNDVTVFFGDDTPTAFTFSTDKQTPDGILSFSIEKGAERFKDKIIAKSLDKNYLVESCTGNLITLKRPITIKCDDVSVFYGDSEKPLTCAITKGSLVINHWLGKVVKLQRESGDAVGEYKISLDFVDENYDVTIIPSVYKILPRPITVVAKDVVSVYGSDLKPSAVVECGSLKGDDKLDEVVKITDFRNALVGVYKIKGELLDENYDLTFVEADYRVLPKKITVSVVDCEKEYGNFDSFLLSTKESLPYGESLDDVVKLCRTAGENVGVYEISLLKILSNNYDVRLEFSNGNHSLLKIKPRKVTINIKALDVEFTNSYEEILSKISYETENGNIVGDDDIGLSYQIFLGDKKVSNSDFGNLSAIGKYFITADSENSNYDLTINGADLTVTKKKISVNVDKASTVYTGDEIKFFDYKLHLVGVNDLATQNSFGVEIKYLSDGNYISVDKILNCGEYSVTVIILDDDIFEFSSDARRSFLLTVEKADIESAIFLEFEQGDFAIIGKNSPIARLNGYNVRFYTLFLYGEEVVTDITKEGEHTAVVTVVDDNYRGEKTFNFFAYNDVLPKIDCITSKLSELKNDKTLKFKRLSEIKEICLSFTDGDKAQINEISDYKSVIDDFKKEYEAFYNEEIVKFEKGSAVYYGINESLFVACLAVLVFFKRR